MTGLLGSSPNSLHSLALASTALFSELSAALSSAFSGAAGSVAELSVAAGASPFAPRTELSAAIMPAVAVGAVLDDAVEPAVSSDVADTTDILDERAVGVRCSSRRCCCGCSLLRGDVVLLRHHRAQQS
jgi:hypothetical protein